MLASGMAGGTFAASVHLAWSPADLCLNQSPILFLLFASRSWLGITQAVDGRHVTASALVLRTAVTQSACALCGFVWFAGGASAEFIAGGQSGCNILFDVSSSMQLWGLVQHNGRLHVQCSGAIYKACSSHGVCCEWWTLEPPHLPSRSCMCVRQVILLRTFCVSRR
jgi:hypothetical protein